MKHRAIPLALQRATAIAALLVTTLPAWAREPGLPAGLTLQRPVTRPSLDAAPAATSAAPPLAPADMGVLLSTSEYVVPRGTRALIFAPHPDDETIAAAGLIQQVLASAGAVRVVFVTNGDGYLDAVRAALHRPDTGPDFVAYGQRRHDEALAALQRLGLSAADARFLGMPDDGIDDLWSGHWSDQHPYRSPYTRFDRPPYRDSIRAHIEYAGVDLESEIRQALDDWHPTLVVTPDPRDNHPDHCSAGVFVLDALRQMHAAHRSEPMVLGYLVHSPDYPASHDWLRTVAHAGVGGSQISSHSLGRTMWVRLPLSSSQRERKAGALGAYDSQLHTMRPFLVQFLRSYEIFSRLDETQILTVPHDYAARFGRQR